MNEKDFAELNQKTFVKETAISLWEGLPRVILAGFLFSLASLPSLLLMFFGFLVPGILAGVFTISPAWSALTAQTAKIVYREPGNVVNFLRAFAQFYRRSVLFGAMLAVPLVAAAMTLPALANPPVATLVWIGLAADAAGLFLLSCLFIYAYPILVLYDANIQTALRNSFILAARYLSNTLGLIALAVLLVIIASEINLILLVIFPACWLVFVINNCRMVLRIELGD